MPQRGGRRYIDVIDADAGAADDFELWRSRHHIGDDFGGGTDRETVKTADDGLQLFRLQAGFLLNFDAALLEDLYGAGGEGGHLSELLAS